MPVSSTEIASIIGGYQQMAMGQMQYSSMLSQYGAYGRGGTMAGQAFATSPGDALMGGIANKGMAIGAPVASFGMSMLGLDPMSRGLSGAWAGFQSGGLMGAATGGIASAALPLAGMAALSYGVGQMGQGAQQQQLLNRALSANFNHVGQFGRGFQRNEMGMIGSTMRDMTGQFGPAGEMTSMSELTALAARMGQMGGGRGIQDVRDFTSKFKEMVNTIKETATMFGTSLEAAQQTLQGMKNSGIFSKGQQMRAMGLVKGAAVGGNLAMEEVMGTGNMGAQISRAIGGRGSAGFTAGVKTAGMIGGALETGVLSEEDIYNATGQIGAEGRNALSASLLQVNASFLRSGRGRRVYASLAGKDGHLDADSLSEYEAGGGFSGPEGTMRRAYGNLGKIGRANFVRNEGKLRGEVLAADPLVGVRQTMAWLESRGVDSSTDLGRLALQRQLKAGGANVGEEELEALVKLVRRQDVIGDNQKQRMSQDKVMTEIGNMNRTTGVEGIKMKLAHARESVQGKLQQAGADFMQSGAEEIDRFVNKITGVYAQTYSRDVDNAFKKGAVSGNMDRFHELTGRKGMYGSFAAEANLGKEMFGGHTRTGSFATADRAGDVDRFREAGWNISGMSDFDRAQRASFAVSTGRDKSFEAAGAANRDSIRTAYAMGQIGGNGDERTESVLGFLASTNQRKMFSKFGVSGTAEVQAASYLRGAGINDDAYASPTSRLGLIGGFGRTAGERAELFGQAALGTTGDIRGYKEKSYVSQAARWLEHNSRSETVGNIWGTVADKFGSSEDIRKAAGSFFDSDKGRDAALGIMSTDEDQRRASFESNRDRLIELRQGKRGITEEGEMAARQNLMLAHSVADMRNKQGVSAETAAREVAKNMGVSEEEALRAFNSTIGIAQHKGNEELRKYSRQARGEGEAALKDMTRGGTVTRGDDGSFSISKDISDAFKGDASMQAYLKNTVDAEAYKAGISGAQGMEDYDAAALDKSAAASAEAQKLMRGKSVDERMAAAKRLRGIEGGGVLAGAFERSAKLEKRYTATKNRRGALGGEDVAAADILGIDLSEEERNILHETTGAGDKARMLLARGGVDTRSDRGKALLDELTGTLKGVDAKGNKLSNADKASQLALLAGDVQKEGALNRDKEKNPLLEKIASGIDKLADKMDPGKIGTAVGDSIAGKNLKVNILK